MCSLNKLPVRVSMIILALFLLIPHANSANQTKTSKNILFFMGFGSYSMRISIWPLIDGLSKQGHQVTYVSAYEPKTPQPGIHDYVPKNLQNWWSAVEAEFQLYETRKSGQLLQFWLDFPQVGIGVCQQLYSDPEAVTWIKNSKFDLIFIDSFYNDCAYGLAHIYQAKTIVLSTTTLLPWFFDAFGIPDESSWAATDVFLGQPVKDLNFFHRVIGALMPVYFRLYRDLYYYPVLEKITKDALHLESVPSFSEMEKNNSMVFLTTHYSQELARSFAPNVVSIGGLALTGETKPLPKNIQDFIDKGRDGFIYISFGTVIEFSSLEKKVQEEFVKALLRFPNIQFIWKWPKGVGVDLPENFMVVKWAPQQDLLANSRIKAFITHAGMGGINEAIYYGVPMVSFPIFAEQDFNANLVEAKQIAIKLEMTTLKSNELENAIREITGNSRIKNNMEKVSSLFKTRPQSALQSALWWTQYVLEHDSVDLHNFLRPYSVNQSWWVRRQLDVWLFVMLVVLVALSIPFYILKWVIGAIIRKSRKNVSNENVSKIKTN